MPNIRVTIEGPSMMDKAWLKSKVESIQQGLDAPEVLCEQFGQDVLNMFDNNAKMVITVIEVPAPKEEELSA